MYSQAKMIPIGSSQGLRSVTFNDILGSLLSRTVGVAKSYAFHMMGTPDSEGPNFMRDRRTYRTASDRTSDC
jgi:hypothetical protein